MKHSRPARTGRPRRRVVKDLTRWMRCDHVDDDGHRCECAPTSAALEHQSQVPEVLEAYLVLLEREAPHVVAEGRARAGQVNSHADEEWTVHTWSSFPVLRVRAFRPRADIPEDMKWVHFLVERARYNRPGEGA